MHGTRCMHVDFPKRLVSCENKVAVILIPKLKVAGSIPVTRSKFPNTIDRSSGLHFVKRVASLSQLTDGIYEHRGRRKGGQP